ncbi:hypothetical protein [Enterovirga aerilata]|uniref:Rap1a immunity protein domain-containing protein n=1 Tax=Enterovirga aerilata TaxID=2730920 RepID=A0A849IDF1_9HYPH|nr:hypothetical protein [Enterovirga sp. DB1703]NNM74245.1 hypothetical protein [Enterovirga sp. DB1703]
MTRYALLIAVGLLTPASVFAQSVKIVGIGAAPCTTFLLQASSDPRAGREYMAWAQGYLSGLLIRAPEGKDENLDLAPRSFPVRKQAEFLRVYCEGNRAADFSDAVETLYKTLRAPPG